MHYTIEHDVPGRMRLRVKHRSITLHESVVIKALMEMQIGARCVAVSHRTGSILVHYEKGTRDSLLIAVSLLHKNFYKEIDTSALISQKETTLTGATLKLITGIIFRTLLPQLLRQTLAILRSAPIILRGIAHVWHHKRANVSVLDASAVGISLLRKDFKTATIITSLLALGDILESWTHKKSRESLIKSLSLNLDTVWIRRDSQEMNIPASDLNIDDILIVRTGSVISADGTVIGGEAAVNQTVMTGESLPVYKKIGSSVYAGSVVEEGEIFIRVTAFDSETRIHKIAEMIDESETLKASIQTRAEKMADAIVPYSFLLAGGIYFLTKDLLRASSALLVDYSCAIKLSTPLAILSAMREGAQKNILIKGGKFLEALSEADVIVFDKTGTLTTASPKIKKIIHFPPHTREDVLRIAACLEEHFPHSVAHAVVRQAEKESLVHQEEHSQVEYVLAHGIASHLHGQRILIGSTHFVIEDEQTPLSIEHLDIIRRESKTCSLLCLAIGNELAGIICIEDPIRGDAAVTIGELKRDGTTRIAILTGDNEYSASNVALKVGIEEFHAQLLPEQKTAFIKGLRAKGRRVIMVGDGINDSPALAAADVGVAMKSGADIAQEVADVVLNDNMLPSLVNARKLGKGVMLKINRNYKFIVGGNSLLLLLGLWGCISPATSALFHNLLTVSVSAYSLLPVLKADVNRTRTHYD